MYLINFSANTDYYNGRNSQTSFKSTFYERKMNGSNNTYPVHSQRRLPELHNAFLKFLPTLFFEWADVFSELVLKTIRESYVLKVTHFWRCQNYIARCYNSARIIFLGIDLFQDHLELCHI